MVDSYFFRRFRTPVTGDLLGLLRRRSRSARSTAFTSAATKAENARGSLGIRRTARLSGACDLTT